MEENAAQKRKFACLLIFILHFFMSPAAWAQKDGLIGYWNFDEGEGLLIHDRSGNHHHGSVIDAQWVKGKIGHALEFDNGAYVEIPDHPQLRLKRDFTITAWIRKSKPSLKGRSMGIVSKSSDGTWDFDLFMSTSKLEHPAFYSDAFKTPGGDIEVISGRPLPLNEWHHVTVTRKGSTASIYLDGVLAGTAALPEDLPTSERNLLIGYDHDGGFGGSIDEVRIYNRALETDEIASLVSGTPPATLSFRHVVIDPAFGGIRVIADINGDQYPDLVHCYWYDAAPLAWYEYHAGGNWSKHIIKEDFYPVTDNFDVADVDGDGDRDIILAKSDAKRSGDPKADNIQIDRVDIVWFENPRPELDPRAAAWKEHAVGIHTDSNENYVKDIKAADLTRDGKPEIVIRSNVAVSVFNQQEGNLWRQILYRKIHPHEGMDVGDVDCDGDLDIVLNGFWLECPDNPLTDTWTERTIDVKWFNQRGDWTANNCKVLVKDMNGDGCADIVLSHSERAGYPVAWYEATKKDKDSWKEHAIGSVDFCHTLQAADMDLDGDVDVITGEMEKSDDPDEMTIFLNGGDGLRWDETIKIRAPIYSGKVGDIGNDGDQDIIGNANFNKPPLELWENLIRDDK